jgi:RNA polymerase sigma factor (sigma-70 family)
MIPFEEDYQDIKENPKEVFINYQDCIIKIIHKEAYKYNINPKELYSTAYILFIKCCNAYDPFYEDRFYPFKSYLVSSLYHNIKKYVQKIYNTGPYSFNKQFEPVVNSEEELLKFPSQTVNVDMKIDLETFLELLPKNYRTVLLLHTAGYTQRAIAKHMNLSQYRISHILSKLKKSMREGTAKHSKLYKAAKFIRNYRPPRKGGNKE